MSLFLAFGSRSVERCERSNQVLNKHWRMSSPRSSSVTLFPLHLIWLRNSRSGFKAKLQKVYFFLPNLLLCLKKYQKNGFLLNLHPDRRKLCIEEPTSLYFLLFQLRVLQCSRCTRKCRCTSHTLTLDESNSKLSVENYGLIRAAEDVVYVF